MKLLRLLWVLVSMYLLGACTEKVSYPEAMQKAMRCMDTYPDSAEIYLSLIDKSIHSEPEETRMFYDLMMTKAKDKQRIPHSSDSIMLQVVHFYESYGDADKLMEAYYYLGSVYRDIEDVPRAVKAYQQAAETGKDSKQYYTLGLIYSHLGTLLAYQSLYEDALKSYKTSYSYYIKENQITLGLIYSIRNQGRMYESLNKLDSAEYFYQAAYQKAFEGKNQRAIKTLSIELGVTYLDWDKPDSTKNIFSKIPEFKNNAIYLKGMAQFYRLVSQPDSAEYYYKESLKTGKEGENIYLKSTSNRALAEIEAQKGNYHTAFDYAMKTFIWEDSIKKKTHTESIGKIHALYNYQHIEKENQLLLLEDERKENMIYLLIIGLLVSILATILYVNYIQRQKRRYEEQQKKLLCIKEEQYKNSQAHLQENQRKIAELEGVLLQLEGEKNSLKRQLFLSQKELLEASNRKIQKAQDEKILLELSLKKSDIYQLFHRATYSEECPITANNWKELQTILDTTYNDFTKRLCTLLPQITEHELHICYLVKIQIPIRDIAKILLRSTSAITNSRARLYKKIQGKDGKAEDLDKLILEL